MKPDIQTATTILDVNLPKIVKFIKKPYSQIGKMLRNVQNGEYIYDKLKDNRKEFGSWFVSLDLNNQKTVCQLIGIVISEPQKELKEIENDPFFQLTLTRKKWDYLPVELALIRGFTFYSINHTSLADFDVNFMLYKDKEPIIDFMGWAKFWIELKKMRSEGVICPERSQIPDFIVNKYGFS